MLAEWLEKEACAGMQKTASDQFEEELSALDAGSIAKVWKEAKSKEANLKQRLLQAVPGAVGGGLSGAAIGGATGLMASPTGERWEGATRGALTGGALGAAGGGIGAAMASPKRMEAVQKLRKDVIDEITGQGKQVTARPGSIKAVRQAKALDEARNKRMAGIIDDLSTPRSGVERAGSAISTLGVLGGGVGGGLHEARGLRREKEKQSSEVRRMASRGAKRVGDAVGTTAVSALNLLTSRMANRHAAKEMLKRTGKAAK